jgi:fumarate hydratase subunit alpha
MKKIPFDDVVAKVKEMSMAANFDLGKDVVVSIEENMKREESSIGREVLAQILQNQEIARNEKIGLCQDTGLAVFFIDMGDEVSIEGGNIRDAVNEGVRQGYGEGYLRKSVCHPFTRKNTGDNTPAVLHIDLVPGDSLKITMAPKGGGSENMSRVMMLKPSDGKEGIIDYIVQRVKESGANPCPPIIVGVGIGGTYEIAALIAKKALLREVGSKNSDPELAEMEAILLSKINNLGIGPQGLGGRTTALAVHINMLPCHIASLPLAVNLNCHSHRHKEYIW